MEDTWSAESFATTPVASGENESFSSLDAEMFGPKRDTLYIVIPITVIYVAIFFSGLIGNVSTCLVIARNKSMHTATNYYLFSLAVSDLLLLVSGLPQEMYSIWSRYPYVFGYTFCILRGLFAETSSNATVLTITAFTVERYVAICYPFLSHTLAKLSRIVKLIIVIWIVSVCLAVPQALQFGIKEMEEGVPESEMCHVIHPIIEHSFEVSTFLFFVAPMTLITVLYVLIGLRLRSSTNMMKKETGESTRSFGTRNVYNTSNVSNRHQNSKSSRRVLKMLVAVVVAFFICWAPFHAQRLFAIYGTPSGEEGSEEQQKYLKVYEVMTYVSGILYYLSTTINPLLYNIMSNKFREAFKETFARWCCPARPGRPQRSYSILSRSVQRGPDSTDSGRDEPSIHTHTSLIRKTSTEATSPHASGRRFNGKRPPEKSNPIDGDGVPWPKRRSELHLTIAPISNYENIQPNTKLVAIHVASIPQSRLSKFMQFFHCIAKKTFDDGKKLTTYYSSPSKDPHNTVLMELEHTNKHETFSVTSGGEISNSSLRDVDTSALEDELTAYMLEVRQREQNS